MELRGNAVTSIPSMGLPLVWRCLLQLYRLIACRIEYEWVRLVLLFLLYERNIPKVSVIKASDIVVFRGHLVHLVSIFILIPKNVHTKCLKYDYNYDVDPTISRCFLNHLGLVTHSTYYRDTTP